MRAPKTRASVRAQALTKTFFLFVWFAFVFYCKVYKIVQTLMFSGDGGAFISKDHGASSKNVSNVVGGDKGSIEMSPKKKN